MRQSSLLHHDDRLIDIITDDYNILPLLSRFSIPLGVANETLRQACSRVGVDINSLLLILNYIRTGIIDNSLVDIVSPMKIVEFLKNSHDYFIGYKFPHIRKNLIAALDLQPSKVNPLILNFFDNFTKKVKEHFDYEEEHVFTYVAALAEGKSSDYSISIFRQHHEEVDGALIELKNIILRYYTTTVPNLMYDVLVDIYNCEEDLQSHADIENCLLIPIVDDIEKKAGK